MQDEKYGIRVYITYAYAYLLNFEDDLHRLLEHQYESTSARYLYRE